MQRDGSACWTTPSGVIRIASTGQTWAQGATGSSQCIQTVGCVATLQARSTKSTITMLSPLCESHSRQAASQARQPMQRDGSTNSVLTANRASSVPLRLRLGLGAGLAHGVGEHLRRARRREVLAGGAVGRGQYVERLEGRGAGLVLRDLHCRVDGRVDRK